MTGKSVSYQVGGKSFVGYFAAPKGKAKAGILIAHTWRGVDDLMKQKAHDLADLGYAAFAADVYGDGYVPITDEEATNCMLPLFIDRAELRKRIVGSYETLKHQEGVPHNNLGAIGFCFGGLTVIELLRSGVDIKGIVSFHGVLGFKLGDNQAVPAKAKPLKGAALILHGNDDPLVSDQDITDIKKEFTYAKIDWQFHIYGNTMHAFTNPAADAPESGLVFNAKANKRSWVSMNNFFAELFNQDHHR